jgi:hypothetical protein
MKPATKYTAAFWSFLILASTSEYELVSFILTGLALLVWLFEYFEEKYEDY